MHIKKKNYFKTEVCIYLDQFATSGMFDSTSNSSEWSEIKKLLTIGMEKKIIVCPMSNEHFLETSQKDNPKAIILDNEFYKLSKGYCFKPELFITSQLIISAIRKNNITYRTFLYENIKKDVLAQHENFLAFDKTKKQFDQKINECTVEVNELRKLTRSDKADEFTRINLLGTCKILPVYELLTRLKDLLAKKQIFIQGIPFHSGEIPYWVDLVIHQLTGKHCMTENETKLLIAHFEKYGFEKIPTLDIRSSLSALLAVENKKETTNDHVDISRIACGLPLSEILLTDKKRKYEIVELGLNEKYKTSVFSGVKDDLENLIKILDVLINQ